MKFTNLYTWKPGDRVMYIGPSLGRPLTRGSTGTIDVTDKLLHIVRVKWDQGYTLNVTSRNLQNLTEKEE